MDEKIERACSAFLQTLIDEGTIEDKELFLCLSAMAERKNYKLCAYQRGIQGTFICFEPTSWREEHDA